MQEPGDKWALADGIRDCADLSAALTWIEETLEAVGLPSPFVEVWKELDEAEYCIRKEEEFLIYGRNYDI